MLIHRQASTLSPANGFNAPQTKLSRVQLLAICAFIFFIAFSVRLLYWQDNYAGLLVAKPTGLQTMSSFYYDQAQRMLDDGGFLFPRSPVDPGDATILTHPPARMDKNPCESVKSASSVVYEFERIPLLVPDRPRMTLIRRICTDAAPSAAICLVQATRNEKLQTRNQKPLRMVPLI